MANVVKKHSISSELAQKMVSAAVAKARELGVCENVAILDDGANLKAFSRMDGAPILPIEIALKKAWLGTPMRSPRRWFFSLPMTAATSRGRNCLWTAASHRCKPWTPLLRIRDWYQDQDSGALRPHDLTPAMLATPAPQRVEGPRGSHRRQPGPPFPA
jgi:Haem-degrading